MYHVHRVNTWRRYYRKNFQKASASGWRYWPYHLFPAGIFQTESGSYCNRNCRCRSFHGNDLGISAMTLASSAGSIITPAAVGFVAEEAGIPVGMGVVGGITILLLITIVISILSAASEDNS